MDGSCRLSMFWSSIILVLVVYKASSLDPYTVITKESSILRAYKGSTFEIRCDVNNRPDGISVRWEREGVNSSTGKASRILIAQDRLPNDQQKYGLKFQPSDTYFLIIKNVDEKDEGHYFCQLPLTLYVKVFDSIYLRVVEKPSIDPLETSSDKFVEIGDDVELTCGAYGRPKPLIKWTRVGNGMMPGGGYIRLTEKLSIPNIQSRYRGQYICTASNRIGDDHRIINLDMDFDPEVMASPAKAVQKIGYETRLFCHVSSQPIATSVRWFVGKTAIGDDSTKYKVTLYKSAFSNVISKLTVYSVSRTEINSAIRCVATSKRGTSETSFKIQASNDVQPIPGASSSSQRIYVTISPFIFTLLVLLSL